MRTAAEQKVVDEKRAERAQARLKSGLFQSLPCHLLPRRFKNYGPMIREFRRDLVEAVKKVHGPEIGFVLAELIQMAVIHHQRHILTWAVVKKEGTKLSPAEIERYLTVGERALSARHKAMVELGLTVWKVDPDDSMGGWYPGIDDVKDARGPTASAEPAWDEMSADDEDAPGAKLDGQNVLSGNGDHAGSPGGSSSETSAAAGASSIGSSTEEDSGW